VAQVHVAERVLAESQLSIRRIQNGIEGFPCGGKLARNDRGNKAEVM
jgi:hypothetical protein